MPPSAFDKYQSKPFPGSSHFWAMRQLEDLDIASRVLDFGSGSGVLGKFLQKRGCRELFAVEVDEEARQQTSAIYRQIEPGLEPFRTQTFDVILLLDILEHLQDPQSLWQTLIGMLSERGKILVSVPNIAHWSVRIPLLFGYFSRYDRGILDRTHLHFFTRRSFLEFIQSAPGVRLLELDSSIAPAEFALPEILWNNSFFRGFSMLRLSLARLFPGLLAYQHLAVLEKIR